MPKPSFGSFFSSDPIIRQTRVRLRRLMNEGFQGLLLSIFLFSAGVTLISIYLHDRAALEEAITTEILSTVGTRQEPSDGARELGLIGAALSKLNDPSLPRGGDCPKTDASCAPVDQLTDKIAGRIDVAIQAEAKEMKEWADPMFKINLAKQEGNTLSWPELGEGTLCDKVGENMFMIIPAQAKSLHGVPYSDRIIRAAKLSSHFDTAVSEFEARYPNIVQAYFISPDSLLRLWSRRTVNACQEFNKARLWAAKSYFAYFWDHPNDDHHSTSAYIDYGGNGLVRTTCNVLELPRTDESYSRGELLGIVCVDAKLPDDQIRFMRRQLFFDTALVTLPVAEENNPDQVRADIRLPSSRVPVANPKPDAPKVASASTTMASPLMDVAADDKSFVRLSRAQIDEERAVDMQSSTLEPVEIQQALRAELRNFTTRPWLREITRIPFRGKTAFLLPLSISGGAFNGLFFFPRSPKLPVFDSVFGVFGFLFLGAAICSAGYNWRLRPKAVALTERLALFRNLQVGIVRVNPADWIIECNDRAEELFARKLPKPGVNGLPVNFGHLIDSRVRETSAAAVTQSGGPTYESITAEEVARMRLSGQASAYYALLRNRSDRSWVRVLATPIMLPTQNSDKTSEVEMAEIFATVTDVAPETVAELTRLFGSKQKGATA